MTKNKSNTNLFFAFIGGIIAGITLSHLFSKEKDKNMLSKKYANSKNNMNGLEEDLKSLKKDASIATSKLKTA